MPCLSRQDQVVTGAVAAGGEKTADSAGGAVAAGTAVAGGKTEVKMIDAGKEAAIEAEVKAARERAIIPLDIRMKQFRDMLAEKEASFAISVMYGARVIKE